MTIQNFSPMIQQYRTIKAQYREAILFFRLGDFYEMFFEDAQTASRELEITLTARQGGEGIKVPMCGVPYFTATNYISKLIKKGYRVAVCEQMEDARFAQGITKREVVQVITPGTVTDPVMLNEKTNNYLMAVYVNKNNFGLAYADASTGEFKIAEFFQEPISKLKGEIDRLKPVEVLLIADNENDLQQLKTYLQEKKVSAVSFSFATSQTSAEILLRHFKVFSLDAFGCSEKKLALIAAAAVINYLQNTQKTSLGHLTKLSYYEPSQYMILDSPTLKNLEIFETSRGQSFAGSLLWVLDQTKTSMGARLLRTWMQCPLINDKEIEKRHNAVGSLIADFSLRQELNKILVKFHDLERLSVRVANGTANARDLIALKASLELAAEFLSLFQNEKNNFFVDFNFKEEENNFANIISLIDRGITEDPPLSIKEGGIIKEGYDEGLDSLRNSAQDAKRWIAQLEEKERLRTGIKSLRVSFNNVFGYFIEITKANLHLSPPDYIRKQTLVNSERFITPELKEKESLILNATEHGNGLEYNLFVNLRKQVAAKIKEVQNLASFVAVIDVLNSFAEVAVANNYSRPKISPRAAKIFLKQSRHPVLEAILGRHQFVANDLYLDNDKNRFLIITGPNMAGKSTFLRQAAINVYLAQIGSFVAAEEAEISLTDRIFARVGAADDLISGQSTFMVEMLEIANILNNATENSLLILDEMGRGTSTFDGISIAYAICEYLNTKIKAKTLFATHFLELTSLADKFKDIKNFNMAVKENSEEVVFLRKVVAGRADKSYGIYVASLAGLPSSIITRAKDVLQTLEKRQTSSPEHRLQTNGQRLKTKDLKLQAANYNLQTTNYSHRQKIKNTASKIKKEENLQQTQLF